eukprot:jgi/Mesvir1/2365/Mv22123-RA.1
MEAADIFDDVEVAEEMAPMPQPRRRLNKLREPKKIKTSEKAAERKEASVLASFPSAPADGGEDRETDSPPRKLSLDGNSKKIQGTLAHGVDEASRQQPSKRAAIRSGSLAGTDSDAGGQDTDEDDLMDGTGAYEDEEAEEVEEQDEELALEREEEEAEELEDVDEEDELESEVTRARECLPDSDEELGCGKEQGKKRTRQERKEVDWGTQKMLRAGIAAPVVCPPKVRHNAISSLVDKLRARAQDVAAELGRPPATSKPAAGSAMAAAAGLAKPAAPPLKLPWAIKATGAGAGADDDDDLSDDGEEELLVTRAVSPAKQAAVPKADAGEADSPKADGAAGGDKVEGAPVLQRAGEVAAASNHAAELTQEDDFHTQVQDTQDLLSGMCSRNLPLGSQAGASTPCEQGGPAAASGHGSCDADGTAVAASGTGSASKGGTSKGGASLPGEDLPTCAREEAAASGAAGWPIGAANPHPARTGRGNEAAGTKATEKARESGSRGDACLGSSKSLCSGKAVALATAEESGDAAEGDASDLIASADSDSEGVGAGEGGAGASSGHAALYNQLLRAQDDAMDGMGVADLESQEESSSIFSTPIDSQSQEFLGFIINPRANSQPAPIANTKGKVPPNKAAGSAKGKPAPTIGATTVTSAMQKALQRAPSFMKKAPSAGVSASQPSGVKQSSGTAGARSFVFQRDNSRDRDYNTPPPATSADTNGSNPLSTKENTCGPTETGASKFLSKSNTTFMPSIVSSIPFTHTNSQSSLLGKMSRSHSKAAGDRSHNDIGALIQAVTGQTTKSRLPKGPL